jgi:hypothetical protein
VPALVGPNTRRPDRSNTEVPPDSGLIDQVVCPPSDRRTVRPPGVTPDTENRPLPPRPGTSTPLTSTRPRRRPVLGSRLAWSSPSRMVAGRVAGLAWAPP